MPALPLLLAAGALARGGHVEYSMVVGLSIVACLLSDVIWYEIGRRSGGSVLRWLCRISLEPDSCVRTTAGGAAGITWVQREVERLL